MESYKHSCPFCGQHIEYTSGYCGRQMQCPICGQTITFPALPPGGRSGPSLRVKGLERELECKWRWEMPASLVFLRNFRHWKTVAQCAVPFLALAALLAGAAYFKNKLGVDSAGGSSTQPPPVQADPSAWQKNTDLNKADQAVRDRMKDVIAARAYLAMIEKSADQRSRTCDPLEKKSAGEAIQRAQHTLDVARKGFDAAMSRYQHLGGTVDYRSQLRDY